MSEKLYAFLLRLFPSSFRQAYGEDALQLFRDRARHETGFPSRFRLWLDLLADLAISVPREYFYAQPELLSASTSGTPGAPSFYVLNQGSPRPGALLFGCMLSLVGLASFSTLLADGVNHHLRPSTGHYQRAVSHSPSRSNSARPASDSSRTEKNKAVSSNPQQPPATANGGSKTAVPSNSSQPSRSRPVHARFDANAAQAAPVSGRASSLVENAGSGGSGLWASLSHQSAYPSFPVMPYQRSGASAAEAAPGVASRDSRSGSDFQPVNAVTGLIRAFDEHDLVLFGEIHGNQQEYEFLRSLVATPEFADRVDDIVLEFGNSLYQKSVDRYISGQDIPLEQVQKAWRNLVGAIGPPSPVYPTLYQTVRETNLKRSGKHQMRILCGDPYIDWDQVKEREDIAPYLGNRDQWYTQVVKDEVLRKHHHALLIMGWGHFLRKPPAEQQSPSIEQQLRLAGASTYLIVVGTNTRGGYDDLDHRFDAWTAPAIVPLADGWVGELPAMPVISGGTVQPRSLAPNSVAPAMKLKDAADALLYLGPRDSLIAVHMTRAELDGTPYGKEIARRLTIEGFPADFVSRQESGSAEVPQFSRPQPGPGGLPSPPPPPKNMGAPLPPRPPSQ